MSRFEKAITLVALGLCGVVLVLAINPGTLAGLVGTVLFGSILLAPVVALSAGIVLFVIHRQGRWETLAVSPHAGLILLALLGTTAALLYVRAPLRVAFALYQPTFEEMRQQALAEPTALRIPENTGPYQVDAFGADDRGGLYFRVASHGDGLGPDLVSYGFCYEPNHEGSPFGSAHLKLTHLGESWFWFSVSNDW